MSPGAECCWYGGTFLFRCRSLTCKETKRDWPRSWMHRRRHLLCLKWPSMTAFINHYSASRCQILWRSVKPLARYGDLMVWDVCHLEFLKIQILSVAVLKRVKMCHLCSKFHGDLSNRCELWWFNEKMAAVHHGELFNCSCSSEGLFVSTCDWSNHCSDVAIFCLSLLSKKLLCWWIIYPLVDRARFTVWDPMLLLLGAQHSFQSH